MFRVAFFVEDKNLAKVLVAVQGLALNMEVPQPVVNATVKGGKVVAVKEGGFSLVNEVTAAVLKMGKGTPINSAFIKDAVAKAGGQSTSFAYVCKAMREAKVIKTTAQRGEYIVIATKEQ